MFDESPWYRSIIINEFLIDYREADVKFRKIGED